MTRKLTVNDVKFTIVCEPEIESYHGHFDDIETIKWISRQLDVGNDWAWCQVTVIAKFGSLTGRDSLGGCSYESERKFCGPGEYFDDMKVEALADLQRQIDELGAMICECGCR